MEVVAGEARLFLLVLCRITGLVMSAPVFGSAALPSPVKAFFALVLAGLFLPLVRGTAGGPPPVEGTALALAAGAELAVGMILGFAASLLFAGVQLGGQLVDQELGFMMANVLDPLSHEQVSIVAQFKLVLSVVLYLLLDGHHFLLTAIRDSFGAVPLMAGRFSPEVAWRISDTMAGDLFRLAVRIAAPAMATLFLVTVAMALLARTVPEMNLFLLGFPVRIGVGLAVLALGAGLFAGVFRNLQAGNAVEIRALLRGLGG